MDQYLQKSLLVLNIEPDKTNAAYFSTKNVGVIQKKLIMGTRAKTGYTISPQNCIGILTAMQYFYVNYPQFTNSDANSEANVEHLNSMVVTDLLAQTVSGVYQHVEYLKSIRRKKEPLEYGKSTNTKGQNSLQFQSMEM